jgi:segregation and condensation protein B
VTDPEDRFLGRPVDPPVDKAVDPDVAEAASGEIADAVDDEPARTVDFYDAALATIQKWSGRDSSDTPPESMLSGDESADPYGAMSTPEVDPGRVDITSSPGPPAFTAGEPDAPAAPPSVEIQDVELPSEDPAEPAPAAADSPAAECDRPTVVGEVPAAAEVAAAAEAGEAAAEASEPNELDSPERLRAAVEAILLVVDTPTESMLIAQVLDRPVAEIEAALGSLRAEYDAGERGLDLREVAGGWRLYTREDFAGYIERFVLEGQQTRLTQAALETLAVIAYRQPITRSRVSAIRGVNVDAVMRTLLTRGLVEECGSDSDTGGGLYQTTAFFLERLGISSLDELPSLAPLLPDTSQLDDVALST